MSMSQHRVEAKVTHTSKNPKRMQKYIFWMLSLFLAVAFAIFSGFIGIFVSVCERCEVKPESQLLL
jgi:heme/copper-type cytochrome/quinol oxidase subunit 3